MNNKYIYGYDANLRRVVPFKVENNVATSVVTDYAFNIDDDYDYKTIDYGEHEREVNER